MKLVSPASAIALSALASMWGISSPSLAQNSANAAMLAQPSYADLADLSDSADVVLRAQVRKVSRVENERAAGLRAGWGRFYIQARTRVLLTGQAPQGEALTYLADLPLDARGKPPQIKKRDVLVFARPVRGRPGELQLVAPDAQVLWTPAVEAQLRTVLTELAAPDAPGPVTGVRELIHVAGNLAGEGETQIFLTTRDGAAASITVQRKPSSPPQWGASFSELIAELGNPPRRDTLAWYRLACFLPAAPPASANLSEGEVNRLEAETDYRMVLADMGACPRTRR
jgi:hypothetical protein